MLNRHGRWLLSVLVVCGCGGGGAGSTPTNPQPPQGSAPTALLTNSKSESQLLATFRAAYANAMDSAERDQGIAVAATADASASGANSFSVTYTAEASVDEHDAVKFDGEYLYVAPSRSMDCCFVMEAGTAVTSDDLIVPPAATTRDRAIRILRTSPVDAAISSVSEIPLADGFSVEGLYHQQDRLLALTASRWSGAFGDRALSTWVGESTGVQLFDLTEPTNPRQLAKVSIDGVLVTSRKTAAGVHVVSRHSPSIDGFVYYPSTEQQKSDNEQLLQQLEWQDVLPNVTVDGAEVTAFSAASCFSIDEDHPLAPDQLGYPTVTTVVTIDPVSGSVIDALCYLEYSDGAYFAADGLFLTQVDFDQSTERYRTYVHRFELQQSLPYAGSGRVDGGLFLGGQNDFRISALGESLRLVTTQYTGDAADLLDHQVFVLQADASEPQLNIVGRLPNSTRPEEIGKPNEDLYGVRFVGDRAYLVTFERTDPLYTLDLSDPADPRIVGALEVTGFSNFLHPVTDDLLLGVGQSQDNDVKLELFDISNFDTPVSRGVLTLGTDLGWSYSAAEFDRHAFSYLEQNTADRFSLPLSGYSVADDGGWVERLQLVEIRNKEQAGAASLVDMGFLSVQGLASGEYPDSLSRGVLVGDAVYFVNGARVFAARWTDPFNQTGPH